MFMPNAHRDAIYENLFKEGIMVAARSPHVNKHPDLPDIPNVHVIKTLKSLLSRGLVTEAFTWRHYCWTLNKEGIVYLRSYLHSPPEFVPATLKTPARSATVRPQPTAAAGRAAGRAADATKAAEDRSAYRRAPAGPDKKGDAGRGAADVELRGGFGRGNRR